MSDSRHSFCVQSNQIFHEGKFVPGWFLVESGRITRWGNLESPPESQVKRVTVLNSFVIPGLIDLHVHGYQGVDASDAGVRNLEKMRLGLAKAGTTSFLATLYPAPLERMIRQIKAVADTEILGVHLEGPFVNPTKIGALDKNHLITADDKKLARLLRASPGTIRKMTVAPELPGVISLIDELCTNQVTVSMGHSDASYSQAKKAFLEGATSVTHLFNAMRPFHHRDPGLVGYALSNPELSLELISDGVHVSESVIQWLAHDKRQICLVSDGLCGTGMKTKHFHAGGSSHEIRGGVAYLKGSKTLSGSCSTLLQNLQRLVRKGVLSLAKAVELCSTNPARELGLDLALGDLRENAVADFLILKKDLSLDRVYLRGKRL